MDDILAPLDARRRDAFIRALPEDVAMVFASPSDMDSGLERRWKARLDLSTVLQTG
jgi:recombinational DNA repair ATPase RecF